MAESIEEASNKEKGMEVESSMTGGGPLLSMAAIREIGGRRHDKSSASSYDVTYEPSSSPSTSAVVSLPLTRHRPTAARPHPPQCFPPPRALYRRAHSGGEGRN